MVEPTDVFGPFPPKSPALEGYSSWREGAADKEAKQNSIHEEGTWGARLILSQLWVGQRGEQD